MLIEESHVYLRNAKRGEGESLLCGSWKIQQPTQGVWLLENSEAHPRRVAPGKFRSPPSHPFNSSKKTVVLMCILPMKNLLLF